MPMKWLSRWEVFALASALFAGLTAFFGKIGVMSINSNLATFIRTVVVLLMTAGILSWRHQWQWPNSGVKPWVYLILSGVATGFSWVCYWRAMSLGPVSKVASIDKLSIAFAVVLGILFLGESLTWQTALGAGLIIAGALVILIV